MALLERATAHDQAKQYKDALLLYEEGLARFLKAYQSKNASAQKKQAIKSKMNEYMTRAEQLKKWLNSKKTHVNEQAAPYVYHLNSSLTC